MENAAVEHRKPLPRIAEKESRKFFSVWTCDLRMQYEYWLKGPDWASIASGVARITRCDHVGDTIMRTRPESTT